MNCRTTNGFTSVLNWTEPTLHAMQGQQSLILHCMLLTQHSVSLLVVGQFIARSLVNIHL